MNHEQYKDEKQRQENFPWERSSFHSSYNAVLAKYKALSCIENSTGLSLLDIACGDGLLTEIFSTHFSRVVGVDASSKHLSVARERLSGVRFYESLIEEFTIEEKFDSVFMLDLLEHVLEPAQVLRKAASFLNDGGRLVVHVPNAQAVNRKIAVLMGSLERCEELSPFDLNIAGHRRAYDLDSLRREVEQAGLKVISTGGIFYKMLSTPQMDWMLSQGPWEEGGHGWGRTGMEKERDWRAEFCRACYEYGKERPEDCNVIYACATLA